jgi:hypothetical protein
MREASVSRARLDQDHLAGAFEVAEQPLAIGVRQVLDFVKQRIGAAQARCRRPPAGSACAALRRGGPLAAQLLHRFLRLFLEPGFAP